MSVINHIRLYEEANNHKELLKMLKNYDKYLLNFCLTYGSFLTTSTFFPKVAIFKGGDFPQINFSFCCLSI